jgi:hypothetical protein
MACKPHCFFGVADYYNKKLQESLPRSKTTGGFLDRMKSQLTSTAAATSVTGNATATAQAAQALMKYSGISSASSNKVCPLRHILHFASHNLS